MSVTDPIADMLTRIRNAVAVRHDAVVMPGSNAKVALARIMKDEGFIDDFEVLRSGVRRTLRIRLKYRGKEEPAISGLKRVSKPGLRIYIGKKEIPRIYGGPGRGHYIHITRSNDGSDAWRRGIGGEYLCYLW